MGQIFSQLTKTGTYDPGSGQTTFGEASGIPLRLATTAAKQAQPDTATFDGSDIGFQSHPVANPELVKPSFLQAVSQVNPNTGMPASPFQNPALSKGGKLATFLLGGLQGALAARAAQEQMIAESGGRRAGGVGAGFQ